jgi:alkylated DNA repair dioxygenase AlkB
VSLPRRTGIVNTSRWPSRVLDTLPGVASHVDRDVGFERQWLDEHTWVDVARGWIAGPDEIYETLVPAVPWKANRLWRYERWVEEPRVSHWYRVGQPFPHPVLVETHRALQARYRVQFDGFSLIWYRDGNDGQAFHRDRDMKYCEDTLVAILTFGARRPWLLRRRDRRDKWIAAYGGAEHDLSPAGGDLFVLGGRAQADWEHSVPKIPGAGSTKGRISAQWRWTSRTGRPEVGGSYSKARHFSRR